MSDAALPKLFLTARYSSDTSAITASFVASLASSAATRACSRVARATSARAGRPSWNTASRSSNACHCQIYTEIGWIWYSSHSSEVGALSAKCRGESSPSPTG